MDIKQIYELIKAKGKESDVYDGLTMRSLRKKGCIRQSGELDADGIPILGRIPVSKSDSNIKIGSDYVNIIADEKYFTIKELVKRVGDSMDIKVKFLHLPFMPLYILSAIVEGICVPLKIKPPIFRRRIDWFRQNRAFVVDRPKKEIGYVPRVGIEEGLKKTAEWYKQEGYI